MESHSFTKRKPMTKAPTIATVELGNQTVKVLRDGNVLVFDPLTRMFTKFMPKFSPLAAEARKASGWFE